MRKHQVIVVVAACLAALCVIGGIAYAATRVLSVASVALRDEARPGGVPTMDPAVAGELSSTLDRVRALPGVASADDKVTLTYGGLDDPLGSDGGGTTHAFHSQFTVAMTAAATARQTAAVVTTMGRGIGWTGVNLILTTPAASGRAPTTQTWTGTFDGGVNETDPLGISEGLFTLAVLPGVHSLAATEAFDEGVGRLGLDVDLVVKNDATQSAMLSAIGRTALRDASVGGSLDPWMRPTTTSTTG